MKQREFLAFLFCVATALAYSNENAPGAGDNHLCSWSPH
jgi:hypothetical protein